MKEDYMGNPIPETREELIRIRTGSIGCNPAVKADWNLKKATALLRGEVAICYWALDDTQALLLLQEILESIDALRKLKREEYGVE